MKLLTTLTLSAISLSLLNAQTTMCFKENHTSMSTVESINLDGGECKSQKSVRQMKNDGWSVDDIEISSTENGKNYIYIFKKEVQDKTMYGNEAAITAAVLAKLEEKKQKNIQEEKIKQELYMTGLGQSKYVTNCETCHGVKGEVQAFNVSAPLRDLSYSDFKYAIRDYGRNDYEGKGMKSVMVPYANLTTETDVKNIYQYLQSINTAPIKKDSK